VEQIRNQPVPADALQRALDRAASLPARTYLPLPRRLDRFVVPMAIAASVMLIAGFGFALYQQTDQHAQHRGPADIHKQLAEGPADTPDPREQPGPTLEVEQPITPSFDHPLSHSTASEFGFGTPPLGSSSSPVQIGEGPYALKPPPPPTTVAVVNPTPLPSPVEMAQDPKAKTSSEPPTPAPPVTPAMGTLPLTPDVATIGPSGTGLPSPQSPTYSPYPPVTSGTSGTPPRTTHPHYHSPLPLPGPVTGTSSGGTGSGGYTTGLITPTSGGPPLPGSTPTKSSNGHPGFGDKNAPIQTEAAATKAELVRLAEAWARLPEKERSKELAELIKEVTPTSREAVLSYLARLNTHKLQAGGDQSMLTGADPIAALTVNRTVENSYLPTDRNPLSTLPLCVDTTSYSTVCRSVIQEHRLPPPDAVRVAEMVNYFCYAYPAPTGEHPVSFAMHLTECPWNARHHLLRIGLVGKPTSPGGMPPANPMDLVARDASVQVEFNPQKVAGYRLIGCENNLQVAQLGKETGKLTGQIGAGHMVTALYEVVPATNHSFLVGESPKDPTERPTSEATLPKASGAAWVTVKMHYKAPGAENGKQLIQPLTGPVGKFARAPDDFRFAAAVASFGMLLRSSEHRGTTTYATVAEIARGAVGEDLGGQRKEFVKLVESAAKLSLPAAEPTATPMPPRP
jgi:hypothetical protein